MIDTNFKLQYKPDYQEACTYWDTFWEHQIIDRPCISITSPKNDCIQAPDPSYPTMLGSDYEAAARMFDARAATTFYGGEAIPFWQVWDFGPDQFSAFLGAEMFQSPSEATSWVSAFVDNWNNVSPLKLDTDNYVWKEILKLFRVIARVSKGKWLVGLPDIHSHLDCLLAIRGGVNLLMDMADCPETIEKALSSVCKIYPLVYEAVYEAGDMDKQGTVGWAPFYCRGKFQTIQCDTIYMISPDMCRRFAIPAIEEEAHYLDHCVFHLDGKGSLNQLDDILAISDIDVIQWVPGAGEAGHIAWIDLFKKIQKAGKGLELHCSAEEVKIFHRELKPEGVLYCVDASSENEAKDIISWLKINT